MARPRIFLSSTFYDLKQVRADLEQFVREMGYDPVLHERGSIPYGSKDKLEDYCYREIQQVDILVSIVGGRYGSQSSNAPYSISQQELKTAYDLGTQVFIFVEHSVLAEYQTYLKNKTVTGISYHFADDIGVYRFLEEIHGLPNNNPITGFSSAQEITTFLREQWAGMFQRFLQGQARQQEVQIVRDLKTNMQTLNQLITYLTEEKQSSDEAIREILRSNHPIFAQLQTLLGATYRVYFANHDEMSRWLKGGRSYSRLDPEVWDDPEVEEWIKHTVGQGYKLLKVSPKVFDEEGNLVIYTPQQWQREWVSLSKHEASEEAAPSDDLPF